MSALLHHRSLAMAVMAAAAAAAVVAVAAVALTADESVAAQARSLAAGLMVHRLRALVGLQPSS